MLDFKKAERINHLSNDEIMMIPENRVDSVTAQKLIIGSSKKDS